MQMEGEEQEDDYLSRRERISLIKRNGSPCFGRVFNNACMRIVIPENALHTFRKLLLNLNSMNISFGEPVSNNLLP